MGRPARWEVTGASNTGTGSSDRPVAVRIAILPSRSERDDFQIFGVVGAIGVPLIGLWLPGWVAIAMVGVTWMAFTLQLLVAPHPYLVGSALGGVAQGGGIAALFIVVVQLSHSDRESVQLSAFVQGIGYVVAALGPTVLGLVHDATEAWTGPLLIVLGTTVAFTVLGTSAGLTQARQQRALAGPAPLRFLAELAPSRPDDDQPDDWRCRHANT